MRSNFWKQESTYKGIAWLIGAVAMFFGVPAHTFVGHLAADSGSTAAVIGGVAQLISDRVVN